MASLPRVAYCAPGEASLTRVMLALRGEQVGEVTEHQVCPPGRVIIMDPTVTFDVGSLPVAVIDVKTKLLSLWDRLPLVVRSQPFAVLTSI